MFPAMLLYLLFVLIRPQDYPDLVERFTLPLQPMALVLAAAFWLMSPRKRFDAPQYPLMVAFLLVLMLSHVANGWFGGALEQLEKFAPVVLAFVVFANGLQDRARLRTVMAAFVFSAAVLAVHGIEQAATGLGWTGVGLSQGTRIQYVGIFNDPNDLGMLFVMCIPMAFYLRAHAGGLRGLWWGLLALVLLYGAYLTNSRGTLLALLVTFGVYVWQTRGVFIAGSLGLVAVAGLLALPSRFSEIDAEEASAQGRVESWYEGLQMFRGDPLLGIGPDMYSDYHHLTAHNSFVLVMAETGLIGFMAFLALIVFSFRMMWAGSRPHGTYAWAVEPEPVHVVGPVAAAAGGPGGEVHVGEVLPGEADEAWDAPEDDADGRRLSLALLLSLAGFFTCAFFLSRSYVVILYLLLALVVAHYGNLRERNPALPAFSFARELLVWPFIAVGGVVGLYLVVKILLVFP